MLRRYYVVFLLMFMAFSGCRKGGCNVIDEVFVNTVVLFGNHPELRVQGGYAELSAAQGGVAGIIVINTGNGYVAYDRCSTVDPLKRCAVEVQDGGLVAVDPCSGAKWILTNGSPAEIAECPLKPYRANLQPGGNAVLVSN